MERQYAVYRAYGEKHNILYVGITGDVKTRMCQHKRTSEWYGLHEYLKVEYFESRGLADREETLLIEELSPPYNVFKRLGNKGDGLSKFEMTKMPTYLTDMFRIEAYKRKLPTRDALVSALEMWIGTD